MPLDQLPHPLIRHVANAFAGDTHDVQRHLISGLSDPRWIKARTGKRFRGAVWVDPATNQAWLCAAGIRRASEGSDFYAEFMADVLRHGASRFLPTKDDRDKLRLEQAELLVSEWELDLYDCALHVVAEAVGKGRSARELPTCPHGGAVGVLVVEVERATDPWDPECDDLDPAGIALQLQVTNWQDRILLERVQAVICSAISPSEQDWDATPVTAVGSRLLATVSESRLQQICASVSLNGVQPPEKPLGVTEPTDSAHYAPSREIAAAAVHGTAVIGLCGYPFVPRQDHAGLPVCKRCASMLSLLNRDRQDR
jgi:hypothetical protein